MAEGDTLTSCKDCRFWDPPDGPEGPCRRHAPAASDRSFQVARWPETRAGDACGEGEATSVTGSSDPTQFCGGCLFWLRPGVGIDPAKRGDRSRDWWEEAGYCRRFAPRPGVDIGDHAFWRITHASDHCFDGRPA